MTDTDHSWHRGYCWLGLQLYMFVIVFVCVIVETWMMVLLVLDLGKKGGYGGSVGTMIITNVITKRYDMSHEIWSTML